MHRGNILKMFYVNKISLALLVVWYQKQCCKCNTSINIDIQSFGVFLHDPAYYVLWINLFRKTLFFMKTQLKFNLSFMWGRLYGLISVNIKFRLPWFSIDYQHQIYLIEIRWAVPERKYANIRTQPPQYAFTLCTLCKFLINIKINVSWDNVN
jgi:hypothetical protein